MTEQEDITLARDLERRASELQKEGRYAEAEAPLLEAIRLWTALRGANDVEVLNDEMNLAVSYRRRGESQRSIPILEKVVQGFMRSADADAPGLLLVAQNNLAAAYRSAQRLSLARKVYESVLATHDRQQDAATPNAERARVLDNLSVVVRECGDAKTAETYARRGLSDWTMLRGRADPDTATAMGALAAALLEQNRLDEAAPLLDEARRFFATHNHRLALGSVLTLVGSLALRRGDRDAARAAFTEALVATREVLPESHPEVRALQASLRAIG